MGFTFLPLEHCTFSSVVRTQTQTSIILQNYNQIVLFCFSCGSDLACTPSSVYMRPVPILSRTTRQPAKFLQSFKISYDQHFQHDALRHAKVFPTHVLSRNPNTLANPISPHSFRESVNTQTPEHNLQTSELHHRG